ncbi:MAG: hypothetical protein M4D85_02535 [Actinomycetota bacterium]|nr:hypothetical protein [Actinomycetota bacterium]
MNRRLRTGRFRPVGLDQLLAVVGSILLPTGLLLILLGWYGAARTPNLFEQVPYLISGGLFGIALVVTGGLTYVLSWVTRAAREQRASARAALDVLDEIRDRLDSAPARPRDGSGETIPSRVDPPLVATAAGRMLHRTGCVVVLSRADLHPVTAATPGMQPCRLCDPLWTGA